MILNGVGEKKPVEPDRSETIQALEERIDYMHKQGIQSFSIRCSESVFKELLKDPRTLKTKYGYWFLGARIILNQELDQE